MHLHTHHLDQRKTGLAFHTAPTMAYAANSAWQLLVVLVYNLLTNFQIETGATRRAPTRKRTVLLVLQSIQTLRFVLFNRAAQIVRLGGERQEGFQNECHTGATRYAVRETRSSMPRLAPSRKSLPLHQLQDVASRKRVTYRDAQQTPTSVGRRVNLRPQGRATNRYEWTW